MPPKPPHFSLCFSFSTPILSYSPPHVSGLFNCLLSHSLSQSPLVTSLLFFLGLPTTLPLSLSFSLLTLYPNLFFFLLLVQLVPSFCSGLLTPSKLITRSRCSDAMTVKGFQSRFSAVQPSLLSLIRSQQNLLLKPTCT